MTQAIAKYEISAAPTAWNTDQIGLIKSQIAVGCTDAELALFGQVCQRTGLDPFSRQIYAIKRNQYNPETRQKEPKMTVQVSVDGFRTIAARSGLYGGSATEWCGEDGIWRDVWLGNGSPAAAKTTVHRIGSPHPFTAVAKFSSYAVSFNGKLSGLWEKMPDLMIGKVSESLALRKAFPAELSGLYTVEEFPPPEPEQIAEPSTKTPTPIELRKEAALDNLEILGWDKSQQREWGQNLNGKPSKEWGLREWERACVDLQERIDKASATAQEDMHHAVFPEDPYDADYPPEIANQ